MGAYKQTSTRGRDCAKNPAKRFLLQTTILVLIHVTRPPRLKNFLDLKKLTFWGRAAHRMLSLRYALFARHASSHDPKIVEFINGFVSESLPH